MAACTARPSPSDPAPAAVRGAANDGASHPSLPDPPVVVPDRRIVVSGRVADATDTAVVGVRVDIEGTEEAVAYSGLDGRFTFHVSPGSYRLSVRGDCRLSPSSDDLGVLKADSRRDFRATSEGCVTATLDPDGGTVGAIFGLRRRSSPIAIVSANFYAPVVGVAEEMRTFAAQMGAAHELSIAGRPALELQVVNSPPRTQGAYVGRASISLETAIVFDDHVLHLRTNMNADTDPATISWLTAVAHNVSPKVIPTRPPPPPVKVVRGTRPYR